MGDETVRANLRLLSVVKKHQYITTSNDHNVVSIVDNTMYNNLMSIITRDYWENTRKCLNKIFVQDVLSLQESLINNANYEELLNLRILLKQSKVGLINMKFIWTTNSQQVAYLNTFIEDYVDIYIHKIEVVLDEAEVTYV